MDFGDNMEDSVRLMIMEIMLILHKNNISRVHMGGLLRLLGVSEEVASESDEDYINLDEEFDRYLSQVSQLAEADDQNKILH
jgi:hypothetical protein